MVIDTMNTTYNKRAYQLAKGLTSEKHDRSSTIQDKSGKCLTEETEILSRCVKSTSNISRICTMSSLISKKPLTEYGMQPYGPPCGSTISVQI